MRRTTLLIIAVLTLAGCSNTAGAKTASGTPGTLPATSSSSAAATPTPSGPRLNSHGHLEKKLGEKAGLSDPAGSSLPWALTFSIDSITVDTPCDSGFSAAPQNGHFIAIAIRASTSPGYPSDWFTQFTAANFQVIGPDGITRTDVQGAANSCKKDSEQFTQNPLGPGQQYTGIVVIDSPVTSGSLIYVPAVRTDGWEWHF